MGASKDPLTGSMSWPGEGMARKKLFERGLYALAWFVHCRTSIERSDTEDGSEKNMMKVLGKWVQARCVPQIRREALQ